MGSLLDTKAARDKKELNKALLDANDQTPGITVTDLLNKIENAAQTPPEQQTKEGKVGLFKDTGTNKLLDTVRKQQQQDVQMLIDSLRDAQKKDPTITVAALLQEQMFPDKQPAAQANPVVESTLKQDQYEETNSLINDILDAKGGKLDKVMQANLIKDILEQNTDQKTQQPEKQIDAINEGSFKETGSSTPADSAQEQQDDRTQAQANPSVKSTPEQTKPSLFKDTGINRVIEAVNQAKGKINQPAVSSAIAQLKASNVSSAHTAESGTVVSPDPSPSDGVAATMQK